ncbi:phosphatase PAP2 family protein [Paenibacillus pinihumi]|uniref:phosphatase PAP2 family protein n=1 Tax=Paenibacillus pinihumi TaxID=669462 RepID=UPI00040BFDE0
MRSSLRGRLQAKLLHKPLKDHSFPSGHTTAIFSIIIPFVFISGLLALLLVPLALLVALTRVYQGLHYPSDCIAGCLLGTFGGLLAVVVI